MTPGISCCDSLGPRRRRIAKRLLRPLLSERVYGPLHSLAKARDIRSGRWSEPELALLPALLRPGETAVDVGANHGLYTFHLSRAVGPGGRVHAFEPVTDTYAGLRRVVRLLGLRNVQIARVALGEQEAEAEMRVPLQPSGALNTGLAHLADRADRAPGPDGARHVRCRLMRLDEFPLAPQVALLKCDVEGAELLVLRGADGLIVRDAPSLLLEVDPLYTARYSATPADLLEHLSARGYRPFRLAPEGAGLVALDRLGAGNHLFLHPRRRDRAQHLIADR